MVLVKAAHGANLLQGDCLSTELLICTLDSVFRRANKEEDGIITAAGITIQNLGYVDNIGLIDKDTASASARAECLHVTVPIQGWK